MHTGRGRDKRPDPIEDQFAFFEESLKIAADAGVSPGQIAIDPGFGFNKETAKDNLDIMARFSELHALGYPIVVGTSRKRFLGNVTGRDPADRGVATAATTALLRMAGAAIFRVHDVAFNVDALKVADAMLNAASAGREGRNA
jgi:dihydropteroate synthase